MEDKEMKKLIKGIIVVLTMLFVMGAAGQSLASEPYAVLRYHLEHLELGDADAFTDGYSGNGVPGIILIRP